MLARPQASGERGRGGQGDSSRGRASARTWDEAVTEAFETGRLGMSHARGVRSSRGDTVPSELCAFDSLRGVHVVHCGLSVLPDEFGRAFSLVDVLNLHNNKLEALPAAIGSMTMLKELNLSVEAAAAIQRRRRSGSPPHAPILQRTQPS